MKLEPDDKVAVGGALTIDVRQYERIKASVNRADRAIGISVLLRDHGANHGPVRLFVPAVTNIADPAKSGFVLKHQPERASYGKSRYFLCQPFGEFFFHSSLAAGSAFGWLLSGASLRQP